MDSPLTSPASNPGHSVWDVYNELRTARLNIKYLQAVIRKLTRRNFCHEVVIAASTSSAFAGFSFWGSALGGYLWKALGAVAAVLSLLKPMLRLQEQISRKQQLLVGYNILDFDLSRIRLEINHRKKYDESLYKQFLKALDRKAELMKQDVASITDQNVLEDCQKAVERELPADSFYIPQET